MPFSMKSIPLFFCFVFLILVTAAHDELYCNFQTTVDSVIYYGKGKLGEKNSFTPVGKVLKNENGNHKSGFEFEQVVYTKIRAAKFNDMRASGIRYTGKVRVDCDLETTIWQPILINNILGDKLDNFNFYFVTPKAEEVNIKVVQEGVKVIESKASAYRSPCSNEKGENVEQWKNVEIILRESTAKSMIQEVPINSTTVELWVEIERSWYKFERKGTMVGEKPTSMVFLTGKIKIEGYIIKVTKKANDTTTKITDYFINVRKYGTAKFLEIETISDNLFEKSDKEHDSVHKSIFVDQNSVANFFCKEVIDCCIAHDLHKKHENLMWDPIRIFATNLKQDKVALLDYEVPKKYVVQMLVLRNLDLSLALKKKSIPKYATVLSYDNTEVVFAQEKAPTSISTRIILEWHEAPVIILLEDDWHTWKLEEFGSVHVFVRFDPKSEWCRFAGKQYIGKQYTGHGYRALGEILANKITLVIKSKSGSYIYEIDGTIEYMAMKILIDKNAEMTICKAGDTSGAEVREEVGWKQMLEERDRYEYFIRRGTGNPEIGICIVKTNIMRRIKFKVFATSKNVVIKYEKGSSNALILA